MEGAGGRVDYHIVAIVKGDNGNTQHDLGYVYHTTHWRQNTYPSDGQLSPCTRALVVPGHIADLIEPIRSAVGRSWLELSKHKCGHPKYTYISRSENHRAVDSAAHSVAEATASTNSCGSPVDEASTGKHPQAWQFPIMPDQASKASIDAFKSIIVECKLLCPPDSGNFIQFKMVRCLQYSWNPDCAEDFLRDRALCQVIHEWLTDLLVETTTQRIPSMS